MITIVKQACADFVEDNCPRIAAALAYYTAFSLAPMLMLILGVCQLVFEAEDIEGRVEAQVKNVIGDSGAAQVKTMIDADEGSKQQGVLSTVIGIALMLFGATGLFAQLQGAMNDVWEVKPDPKHGGIKSFLLKRLVSLGMVLTIAFLLMVSITASTALHAFDSYIDRLLPGQSGSLLLRLADYAISLTIITCLFAGMFKVLPDAKIDWTTVWMGAIATAMLFVVGKFLVGLYAGNQNMANTYGAAGSLVMILVWVYYSAMIFLLGAEFTQAWAKHRGPGILPADGAVRIVQTTQRHDQ